MVQTDLFYQESWEPLQFRGVQFYGAGKFIAIENGAPYGHGALICFTAE